MTDWQPIETAPKDGRFLVVDGGHVHMAYRDEGDDHIHLADTGQPMWAPEASHWMPVPAPPS